RLEVAATNKSSGLKDRPLRRRSVSPVGAGASGGISPFNGSENIAAIEERESPVKHPGVGPGQSIGNGGGSTGGESSGVGNYKIKWRARSVRSAVGSRKI